MNYYYYYIIPVITILKREDTLSYNRQGFASILRQWFKRQTCPSVQKQCAPPSHKSTDQGRLCGEFAPPFNMESYSKNLILVALHHLLEKGVATSVLGTTST